MTYEEFTEYVDTEISNLTGGYDRRDFADADWRSLFRDTGGHATTGQIIGLLSEADSFFSGLIAFDENPEPATLESFIQGEIDLYGAGQTEIGTISIGASS